MYIDISKFISNESELFFNESGTCKIEYLDNNIPINGDAIYELLISKVDRELILNIDIEFKYSKPCDRCLAEVENFEEINYSAKLVNNNTIEDTDDDFDIVVMSQNQIDICKLVKELVILSIPMKNLCSDNCQGLCPKCGKDLNKGNCDCDTETIDSRFSVLKDFQIDEEV